LEAVGQRLVRALQADPAPRHQVGAQQADEQCEVGVADEADEAVGNACELGERPERDHQQRNDDGRAGQQQAGTGVAVRRLIGLERTNEALTDGFKTSGEILLITGVGGSLGAIITASGMGAELGKLFSTDAGGPVLLSILLAWFIAAVLHVAIGSVSVAALTAAGIIGPVVAQLSTSPVIIGFAIASGALFAVQVNSNFFWMFKGLLGLSTKGALKTLTLVTSLASLVSLPLVVLASLFA
ncbi:MAG: hypothetical protein EOO24_51235, partial [Comamonadaceae bacterium]